MIRVKELEDACVDGGSDAVAILDRRFRVDPGHAFARDDRGLGISGVRALGLDAPGCAATVARSSDPGYLAFGRAYG